MKGRLRCQPINCHETRRNLATSYQPASQPTGRRPRPQDHGLLAAADCWVGLVVESYLPRGLDRGLLSPVSVSSSSVPPVVYEYDDAMYYFMGGHSK